MTLNVPSVATLVATAIAASSANSRALEAGPMEPSAPISTVSPGSITASAARAGRGEAMPYFVTTGRVWLGGARLPDEPVAPAPGSYRLPGHGEVSSSSFTGWLPCRPPDGHARLVHGERLAAYWAEALGGSARYSEAYGSETSVVRLHSGKGPHEEMDRRAIACFDQALVDTGMATDDRLGRVLHDYFAWATTTTMARYHDSAEDVPDGLVVPHWSWDGLDVDTIPTRADFPSEFNALHILRDRCRSGLSESR